MRVSVIGLGRLGSPLSALLAARGFYVIGADNNPAPVAALAAGSAPVEEPGLQALIDEGAGKLYATADVASAVTDTDVTFVVVPTPSGRDGIFTNKHVLKAMQDIGAGLSQKHGYHLVVITSTVMPGSTGGPIREALEASTGRKLGERLGLCYNPEFIALGSVIHNMVHPDLILIGESDRRAGDVLAAIRAKLSGSAATVQRMNFVNAEIAKMAVNSFVTTKISFANMLSEICMRFPAADAQSVTAALGCDSRIGKKYLTPALGYGGPCFPRDNVALATMARQLGVSADIAEATDTINRRQVDRIVSLVESLEPRGTVGILGLAYKPHTSVIEESQSIALAAKLAARGYRVLVSDPEALGAASALLGDQATAVSDAEECASLSDLLIIATPWPAYKALSPRALQREGRQPFVVDCWRICPRRSSPIPRCSSILGSRWRKHTPSAMSARASRGLSGSSGTADVRPPRQE